MSAIRPVDRMVAVMMPKNTFGMKRAERQRAEPGHQHQRRDDHRRAGVRHQLAQRLLGRVALPRVSGEVGHDVDGVVDRDAQADAGDQHGADVQRLADQRSTAPPITSGNTLGIIDSRPSFHDRNDTSMMKPMSTNAITSDWMNDTTTDSFMLW